MRKILEFFSSNKDKKPKSENTTKTTEFEANSSKKVKFQNFNTKLKETDNKNIQSNIFTVNNTL